ncbi:MAG: DUF1266 domain-containing protein [Methanomassiliicoccaceae archaeon]|nr:DUF1266 domain-containing protein [Methanomassiliicoccaceae archaeon]
MTGGKDPIQMAAEMQARIMQLQAEYMQNPTPENLAKMQAETQRLTAELYSGGIGDLAASAADLADSMAGAFEDMEFGMGEEELAEFIAQHAPPPDKARYLPIGAVLIMTNVEPCETLAMTDDDKESYAANMKEWWGIKNRAGAMDKIEWLLGDGHTARYQPEFELLQQKGPAAYKALNRKTSLDDESLECYELAIEAATEVLELPKGMASGCKTIRAWDIDRVGLLARICAHIGYITEDEAWGYMKRAGEQVKPLFKTWDEYIVSVLFGRAIAIGLHQEPYACALELLTEKRGFLDSHPISGL